MNVHAIYWDFFCLSLNSATLTVYCQYIGFHCSLNYNFCAANKNYKVTEDINMTKHSLKIFQLRQGKYLGVGLLCSISQKYIKVNNVELSLQGAYFHRHQAIGGAQAQICIQILPPHRVTRCHPMRLIWLRIWRHILTMRDNGIPSQTVECTRSSHYGHQSCAYNLQSEEWVTNAPCW